MARLWFGENFRGLGARAAVLLFVSLPTAGCVAFSQDLLPKVTSFSEVPGQGPSARILVEFQYRANGVLVTANRRVRETELEKQVVEVLGESGYFSRVGNDIESPDLQLLVAVTHHERFNRVAAYVAMLTLTLFPVSSQQELVVETTVRSLRTDREWRIRFADSMRLWIQPFLVVVMPTRFPNAVADALYENLFRNLALALHEEGILRSVPRP